MKINNFVERRLEILENTTSILVEVSEKLKERVFQLESELKKLKEKRHEK